MTREEAIQWLEAIKSSYAMPLDTYEAIDMAISALHFEADCRSCMWREKYEEQTEPSDFIRQETIKELGDWLEQMIQHGVPSHSAKRKALANAIALLSMDTHEIHTETHECVKETHDSDLISRADAIEAVASRDSTDGHILRFTGREITDTLSALPSADAVQSEECDHCVYKWGMKGGEE